MLAISRTTTRPSLDGPEGTSFCGPLGEKPAQTPYTETSAVQNWETLARASGYRLPEIARLCQVSLRTLQRHFRRQYNTTVSEWIHELRLERARSMLVTAESVKRVAFELGYKQPSHFTRHFKERYGVPPSALRSPLPLRIQISPTGH